MRDRSLLALARLESFAAWAAGQGWKRHEPRGAFEVLRLRRAATWALFHKRSATNAGRPPIHATCEGPGYELVKRWMRERDRRD